MTEKRPRKIFLSEFKVISHAISTYNDFPLMIKHLVEACIRYLEVKGCSLLLWDQNENQLFHVRSQGVSEKYLRKGAIFVDEKYSAFVSGEPIFIENLQNDPRIQYPECAEREGFVSMLSLPIKCRETTVGLMRIYDSKSVQFHEEDINSLCVLGEQMGLAIENNGLKNFLESIKSALESLPTEVLNR